MESINLGMNDLFDTDAVDDDDLGAMAPLPDLDDENAPMRQGSDDDQDGEASEEVLNKLKELKGAGKKKVLRPQPKLDVDRLKLNRGLPELATMFDNVKFKGKGHEFEDLRLMMGKLEHWAHRLFPKMPFDEFIERLERLGQKKQVQTCVRKIRMGMPMLDAEVVQNMEEAEEAGDDEEEPRMDDVDDIDAEEAFEEMLRKERELKEKNQNSQSASTHEPASQPSSQVASSQVASSQVASSQVASSQVASSQADDSNTKTVTEEQKDRMERNKRLAMERRAAKLGKKPDFLSQTPAKVATPATKTTDLPPTGNTSTVLPPGEEKQQTEDDILRELDMDDMDELKLQQTVSQSDKTDSASLDDLHLRMTTDSTEHTECCQSEAGTVTDKLESNLQLHMTSTDDVVSAGHQDDELELNLQIQTDEQENTEKGISEYQKPSTGSTSPKKATENCNSPKKPLNSESDDFVLNLSTSDNEMTVDE